MKSTYYRLVGRELRKTCLEEISYKQNRKEQREMPGQGWKWVRRVLGRRNSLQKGPGIRENPLRNKIFECIYIDFKVVGWELEFKIFWHVWWDKGTKKEENGADGGIWCWRGKDGLEHETLEDLQDKETLVYNISRDLNFKKEIKEESDIRFVLFREDFDYYMKDRINGD